MTEPRDRLEAERLETDNAVIERRRSRDDQIYRDWCESTYGEVAVGPETFHPADILDALAPSAAQRGRDEAVAQAQEDIEGIVCEQFPALIAVPFQGFIEGPLHSLTRLHRLRDTWESLIRLLAAIALSEAASIDPPLAQLRLREGASQGWRGCKRRDLFSNKLSVRIGLIEGVLKMAHDLRVPMKLASMLPLDIVAEIRRLNVVRNGFSHEATKSDVQAQTIIDDSYPVVRELLLDLREMENIELMRVKKLLPGNRAEIERLFGHAQSRRVSEIEFDQQSAFLAISAGAVDGLDRVLARIDDTVLDLSPFVYAADDETGYRTRVLEFKSKGADKWILECVADSTIRSSPCETHEELLVRYHSLFEKAEELR